MSARGDERALVRPLREENETLNVENEKLKSGGGGGTSGGVSDDWKTGVNGQLTQLHQDVRNLLYGLVGLAVLLAGAGFSLYSSLDDKFTELKIEQSKIDTKLDLLLHRSAQPSAPAEKS